MKKFLVIFALSLLATACHKTATTGAINTPQQQPQQQQSSISVTPPANQSQQIAQLQQEVDQLKNQKPPQVIIKEQPAPQPNLPSIIQEWQSKMAYIQCSWQYSNAAQNYSASGSGLVSKDKFGTIYVYTNRHVVADSQGYTPSSCDLTISGDPSAYHFSKADYTGSPLDFAAEATNLGQSFYVAAASDFAMIRLYAPDEYTKSIASTLNYCKTSAPDGDAMVILGYPAIGSQTGITATEGIISGTDGNYYITSAKVDHGDSGGAAILEKNDCYLGIPTYALTGGIESLARILDVKTVPEVQYTIGP